MENKTENKKINTIYCLYTDSHRYPTCKLLQSYLGKIGVKADLTIEDESDPDEIYWRAVCLFTTKDPAEKYKKMIIEFGLEADIFEFEVNDGRC